MSKLNGILIFTKLALRFDWSLKNVQWMFRYILFCLKNCIEPIARWQIVILEWLFNCKITIYFCVFRFVLRGWFDTLVIALLWVGWYERSFMILMDGIGTFREIVGLLIIEYFLYVLNNFLFTWTACDNIILTCTFNCTSKSSLASFYEDWCGFYVHFCVIIFNFYHRLLFQFAIIHFYTYIFCLPFFLIHLSILNP